MDEIVGRTTPSIGLTAYIEPTIMAPVEPALANPSMAPLARWPNPTVMLESALAWKALAGWSPISITSVVATIPNRSAGHPSEASTDLIFSSSPNSTIRLSDPIASSAMTAPLTAASGA